MDYGSKERCYADFTDYVRLEHRVDKPRNPC